MDEWAHRHRETTLVSAMGCDLTIVTVGITGKKTIGKRTEPREAFYLRRNLRLSTWWHSSQNKNRKCCNFWWERMEPPLGTLCWQAGPSWDLHNLPCAANRHMPATTNTSIIIFPASQAWKRPVEQLMCMFTGNCSRNEGQKRRKHGPQVWKCSKQSLRYGITGRPKYLPGEWEIIKNRRNDPRLLKKEKQTPCIWCRRYRRTKEMLQMEGNNHSGKLQTQNANRELGQEI